MSRYFCFHDVAEQHGRGVDVVDRNIEEARDLVRVHVDEQHAVDAGRGNQVRDQLGRDRHARGPAAAVLPAVAEVRNHGRDARGGRALARVGHDQELHQVLVHGRARGLHDEHVAAAHVLHDLDVDLAVAETADGDAPQREPQVVRDIARESGVSFAGKNRRRDRVQGPAPDYRVARLAGAVGIEPTYGGIKTRCLTAWLRPNRTYSAGRVAITQGEVGRQSSIVSLSLSSPCVRSMRRGTSTLGARPERVAS